MKNHLIYKIFLAFLVLICIVSCEEREDLVVEPTGSAIIMDLSTDNLILDENFPANPALTITWEPSKYSIPVEVKYTLEISSTESFEVPYVLTNTLESQTNASFSMKEMNDAAKKIGLIPYENQKMYFRVASYIGTTNSLEQVSKVSILNVTPYAASPPYEYADLFLIGNATAGGWENEATNTYLLPLLKTSVATKYTFTGFFKEKSGDEKAGFKMIREKGSWDAQFGLGSAAGQLSTDGGSGNLSVPADGYYKLTVDVAALNYTLVPISVSPTTYTAMSIIGSATEDTDIQLTPSVFDPHLWTASEVTLKEGVFKFRANNSWDNNWGSDSEYFGTAVSNGADIPMNAEWKYDLYFNDATGDYTIIPVD